MTIDHKALVEVVQALVQVPSVYDPATGGCEEGAARLVAHQLRSFGWTPELDPVMRITASARSSIVISLCDPTLNTPPTAPGWSSTPTSASTTSAI